MLVEYPVAATYLFTPEGTGAVGPERARRCGHHTSSGELIVNIAEVVEDELSLLRRAPPGPSPEQPERRRSRVVPHLRSCVHDRA